MTRRARRHWLLKSEPDVYAYEALERDGRARWDGVRNYTARNHLRSMSPGDPFLFYHSSCPVPAVVGIGRVVSEPYPDPTQFDCSSPWFDPRGSPEQPRWWSVDVEPIAALPHPVTLAAIRADPLLRAMLVAQPAGARLSVQPVERTHFTRVLRLGGLPASVARGARTRPPS
ncbi:MAG: EVE domain-containing protein [Myxococcota bacterium]|nr:EVE domain-containing protein [Myxococcota bacterium]MDW8361116.1 EVE domain-containing protein [Myxococcales bacterium]